MLEDKCPFCSEIIKANQIEATFSIECPRCGNYRVDSPAVSVVKRTDLSPRQRANISGWLFENPGFLISTDNFPSLLRLRTPSFHSRADKLLVTLEKETEYAGQYLEVKLSWLVSSWATNRDELIELV